MQYSFWPSYTNRLWPRVSYITANPITKGRSIELAVTKIGGDFLRPKSYLHTSPHPTSPTMESSIYRFPKLKGNKNYESWRIDIISELKVKERASLTGCYRQATSYSRHGSLGHLGRWPRESFSPPNLIRLAGSPVPRSIGHLPRTPTRCPLMKNFRWRRL